MTEIPCSAELIENDCFYFHQVWVFHENRGYRGGGMLVAVGRFDRIAPL
jgi:hypothetical protein